ncbi:MAG TPA: response regulator [Verrucomicrobiales bacterium]|nr:response regulator [Verrucomicrobiales bacterium]
MESLKEDTDTFSHFGAQVADRDAGLRTEFFVKKDDSAAPKTASTVTNSQSKEANQTFSILIVDDDEMNRDVLERRLNRQGYRVQMAENGRLAVDLVQKEKFDLILLDLMMPVLDGFGALTEFKNNAVTRHIPVIMLSARDEIDNVVRCIEIGAEDYLPKPFNPLLLNARIEASLEKKRLRDQEQAFVKKLYVEREKSKRLLLNILPASIADRLKDGQTNIAESFEKASVLFARIHGITELSKERSPQEIVTLINDLISGFDWLAEFYRFEKANTLGDTYMAVSGVPTPRDDYVQVNAEMALEMMRITKRFNSRNSLDVQLRIGISSGPVMAGIIGKKFITYYFWGETVDIANKMETHGKSGSIQVSSSTQQLLTDKYDFTENEEFDFSQDQTLETFFLTGRK